MIRPDFAAMSDFLTAMNQTSLRRASVRSTLSGWPSLAKAAALAVLLGSAADLGLAQNGYPPSLMSYQGYLVDANGVGLAPTTPMNFSVVFRIYGTSTGGTSIWTEAQTVTVDKGNFSVVLGEGGNEGAEPRPDISTVFNSSKASDLYLGITVKGISSSEILPRLRLLTSPYSFLARTANALAGSDGASLIKSDSGRLLISQTIQSTSSGGNARGANAVDLQTLRNGASPGQVASGAQSVIAGGYNNTASGASSVVAGGGANTASGQSSFVGGGDNNTASGGWSTVPGGTWNEASGNYSVALGRRAKARHQGTLIFGDSQDADRQSTADNQVLFYASGGVSINAAPATGAALTVSGKLKTSTLEVDSMTVGALTSTSVSGFGTVPVGGIIMWSGSVDAVPAGWALCNGQTSNNKITPDLRGRFIVGAGAGAGSGLTSKPVGEIGGSETVTISVSQLPAHNHRVRGNTGNNGSHTHAVYSAPIDDRNFTGRTTQALGVVGDAGSPGSPSTDYSATTSSAGDHNHAFDVTSDSTGDGAAVNNMPPYYALAFIMRVQ